MLVLGFTDKRPLGLKGFPQKADGLHSLLVEFAVKQCKFIHDLKQTLKSSDKNQTLVALHTLQEQFSYDKTILSPVKNFNTTKPWIR